MTSHIVPGPEKIPTLSEAASISPILLRLLECPTPLLSTLSNQVLSSLQELPDDDRPTSYEGLIDVARFCVEEEPGWNELERARLLEGHPRIGRQKGAISAVSAQEQGGQSDTDEATYDRLARLNFLYERRFPGLRFVTFVAGRPRKTIADELEKLLGSEIVGLAPQNAQLDPDDLKQSWSGFPSNQVLSRGSAQWKAELERGEGALWEIAGARAAKLTEDVAKGQVTVEILSQDSTTAQPTLTATDSDAKPAPVADEKQDAAAFDTPFLSQATFRALILASPILHSFFEEDLPSSVLLQPVERHTTTKEALLSAYNDATGGVSSSSGRPVVTRERVKGLLGGLLGEVADAVGGRLQQRTVSGPKPAFAARGPSAAKRGPGGLAGLSLEEAAGGKMAPVSPAALSARGKASATGALDEKEERQKAQYAAREVQAAHEALLNRDQRSEANQFVIDAPGEDGDETVDIDDEDEEDADLAALAHADDRGDPVGAGSGASKEEKGRLSGKEAALAKDLRSAEVQ